jgi:release factor glutamine methyltransferase
MRQNGWRGWMMREGLKKVRTTLSTATQTLAAISDSARLDAELLMAHALGVERAALLLTRLDAPVPQSFDALLARRLAHEPIAYITGCRDFWTIRLSVTPDVLIPRPDSETLIEAALDHFRERVPATILDLGTGSGSLLLAALSEWPDAQGIGVDASDGALAVARANAERLRLSARAVFHKGDWAADLKGHYDLILCNPPYVEADAVLPQQVAAFEPANALFAGADGLDDYRRIAPQLPALLAPQGCALIEIGHLQAESAGALFRSEGFTVRVRQDLGGRDRCLILTK